MNRLRNLVVSGIALSLAGVMVLVSENLSFGTSKILIPSLIILSGVFAILFANSNSNSEPKRPIQYLLYQGGIYILFGLICAFGVKSLNDFLNYITYFVLFISLFDLGIGFAIVNANFKGVWGILLFKFLGALLGLISGVAILATSVTNQISGLYISAIVLILMGIGTTIFALKIKKVSA